MLGAWAPAEKRRFVKFVTGSARLPALGSEVMTVQVAYAEIGASARATLGMLPQVSKQAFQSHKTTARH